MLSEKEKNKLLRDVYSGKVTARKLPENLYIDIALTLQKGLFKGYNDNIKVEIRAILTQGPEFELLQALTLNIYRFSAAKTFQWVKEMQTFIVDDQGQKKSFSQFRKDVDPYYTIQNEQWTRTEFDTSFQQAQSASQWQEIQKDKETLPNLRYETAGDERVRPEHAGWSGITRPVDDPFWDSHMPPNGFLCRCIVSQVGGSARVSSLKGVKPNTDKQFTGNPAKTEVVFKEKGVGAHPYFVVGAIWQAFKNTLNVLV